MIISAILFYKWNFLVIAFEHHTVLFYMAVIIVPVSIFNIHFAVTCTSQWAAYTVSVIRTFLLFLLLVGTTMCGRCWRLSATLQCVHWASSPLLAILFGRVSLLRHGANAPERSRNACRVRGVNFTSTSLTFHLDAFETAHRCVVVCLEVLICMR